MIRTTADGVTRKRELSAWFRVHGRSFPWRETDDAWIVFMAEMLLRRTRAEQVARVFPDVVRDFPDPRTLAIAPIEDVESAIGSLGLIGRAWELRESAAVVVSEHDGEMPCTVVDLQSLPGVGPYVAAMVVASCSSERVVLIDTNTVRVATRVAGLEVAARDVRRQRAVVAAIEGLFGGPVDGPMWWAVIDLAALVCRPTHLGCARCPLSESCVTGQQDRGIHAAVSRIDANG